MLKTDLLHPEILAAVAAAGHGSGVLIADAKYPLATHTHPRARRVFLNLAPGRLNAVEVARVLAGAIPVERVHAIFPEDGQEPAIHADFRSALGIATMARLGREDFYSMAREPNVCLAIATGEQRLYACVILTIGVVNPD